MFDYELNSKPKQPEETEPREGGYTYVLKQKGRLAEF
jgi:hypothetical protein